MSTRMKYCECIRVPLCHDTVYTDCYLHYSNIHYYRQNIGAPHSHNHIVLHLPLYKRIIDNKYCANIIVYDN